MGEVSGSSPLQTTNFSLKKIKYLAKFLKLEVDTVAHQELIQRIFSILCSSG